MHWYKACIKLILANMKLPMAILTISATLAIAAPTMNRSGVAGSTTNNIFRHADHTLPIIQYRDRFQCFWGSGRGVSHSRLKANNNIKYTKSSNHIIYMKISWSYPYIFMSFLLMIGSYCISKVPTSSHNPCRQHRRLGHVALFLYK